MTEEVLEVVEVVEVDVDVEVDDDEDEDDATERTDDEVVADVVSANNHTKQREMHTRLSCGGFHRNWGRKIGGYKSSGRIRVGRRLLFIRIKSVQRIDAIPVPIAIAIAITIAVIILPQV